MRLHEILFFFFECDNETLCIERPSLPHYRFCISKESPTILVALVTEKPYGTVVEDLTEQDGFFDSDFNFDDWRVWRPNRKRGV